MVGPLRYQYPLPGTECCVVLPAIDTFRALALPDAYVAEQVPPVRWNIPVIRGYIKTSIMQTVRGIRALTGDVEPADSVLQMTMSVIRATMYYFEQAKSRLEQPLTFLTGVDVTLTVFTIPNVVNELINPDPSDTWSKTAFAVLNLFIKTLQIFKLGVMWGITTYGQLKAGLGHIPILHYLTFLPFNPTVFSLMVIRTGLGIFNHSLKLYKLAQGVHEKQTCIPTYTLVDQLGNPIPPAEERDPNAAVVNGRLRIGQVKIPKTKTIIKFVEYYSQEAGIGPTCPTPLVLERTDLAKKTARLKYELESALYYRECLRIGLTQFPRGTTFFERRHHVTHKKLLATENANVSRLQGKLAAHLRLLTHIANKVHEGQRGEQSRQFYQQYALGKLDKWKARATINTLSRWNAVGSILMNTQIISILILATLGTFFTSVLVFSGPIITILSLLVAAIGLIRFAMSYNTPKLPKKAANYYNKLAPMLVEPAAFTSINELVHQPARGVGAGV